MGSKEAPACTCDQYVPNRNWDGDHYRECPAAPPACAHHWHIADSVIWQCFKCRVTSNTDPTRPAAPPACPPMGHGGMEPWEEPYFCPNCPPRPAAPPVDMLAKMDAAQDAYQQRKRRRQQEELGEPAAPPACTCQCIGCLDADRDNDGYYRHCYGKKCPRPAAPPACESPMCPWPICEGTYCTESANTHDCVWKAAAPPACAWCGGPHLSDPRRCPAAAPPACEHEYGPVILTSEPPQKRCLKCGALTVWPRPAAPPAWCGTRRPDGSCLCHDPLCPGPPVDVCECGLGDGDPGCRCVPRAADRKAKMAKIIDETLTTHEKTLRKLAGEVKGSDKLPINSPADDLDAARAERDDARMHVAELVKSEDGLRRELAALRARLDDWENDPRTKAMDVEIQGAQAERDDARLHVAELVKSEDGLRRDLDAARTSDQHNWKAREFWRERAERAEANWESCRRENTDNMERYTRAEDLARELAEALADTLETVECQCEEAYTGRGLHAPECRADEVDVGRAALARAKEVLGE